MNAHSIDTSVYLVETATQDDDSIIASALAILAARIKSGPLMGSSRAVREYLTVQASKHSDREVFSVLFLDAQNRAIEFRELFSARSRKSVSTRAKWYAQQCISTPQRSSSRTIIQAGTPSQAGPMRCLPTP